MDVSPMFSARNSIARASVCPSHGWISQQKATLSLGQPTLLPHSRLSSNQRLLLNSLSSCFRDIALRAYWGHEFDLSGSRDVIGHVTIRSPYAISYWWSFGTKPLSVTVSEIFNGKCDTMVDRILNGLQTKVKVIHCGTYRFLIYNFLQAVNSNFCSRMHR